MDIVLRAAMEDDEPAICGFFRASTKEDRAEKRKKSRLGPYHPPAERNALVDIVHNRVLVAIDGQNGQPVGYGRLYLRQKPVATLHKLYVHPDYRGGGIAQGILHVFEHAAKAAEKEMIRVTIPSDDMALFYQKCGFSFSHRAITNRKTGHESDIWIKHL